MYETVSRIIWFLVRIALVIVFFGTPIVGFWLASSLAAFQGGPAWLAWTAGALLFPILPGLWELHAWAYRRSESKPTLTVLDRLGLRTFVIGFVFVAALLYRYPQLAFVSLSTRGDWMLDRAKGPEVERARRFLFATAGGLEWLYRASRSNPYRDLIDKEAQKQADEAAKQCQQDLAEQREQQNEDSESESDSGKQNQDKLDSGEEIAEPSEQEKQEQKQGGEKQDERFFRPDRIAGKGDRSENRATESGAADRQSGQIAGKSSEEGAGEQSRAWPWKGAKLHPAVAAMPASVETSIQSVARYLVEKERDPVLRVKAAHDYVADRVAYDYVSYYAGKYPPQDARTVFKTRKSVCAGYANLLSALGKAMKEEIVVVVGDCRSDTGERLTGSGHAWNAARIEGRWYLIDATWDSGSVSREEGFSKNYQTEYLLTPPGVMILDHYPDNPTWQLLPQALSQGEFLRQPMLSPSFYSAGLKLVQPNRARNESGDRAVAVVKNPMKQWLMVDLEQNGKSIGNSSQPVNSETAELERHLPDKGMYRMNIFINETKPFGEYQFVGALDYVNR
ncbi:MAG: transglutaminase [Candidatus Melainabacteria bacterium]|nr:transglutaminase [Candidatus Melainabacteria bacterium]